MDTDDRLIEGLSRWVRQERLTREAAHVNAMVDLAEADTVGIASERVPGRRFRRRAGAAGRASLGAARHPRPVAPRHCAPAGHGGARPAGAGRGRPALRPRRVRHEGRRLPRAPSVQARRRLRRPAAHVPPHAGRGDRLADFARADRGAWPAGGLRAGDETGARRRQGGHRAQGRRAVPGGDRGAPSHAGTRYAEGRSAIREAAGQITAIEAMTDTARGVTTAVRMVSGGTAENVIPQWCRFTVDLRVETAADGDGYERRLLGLEPIGPGMAGNVTGGMNRPPYERTEGGARLFEAARAIAAECGRDLAEAPRSGGVSDGNFTAALGIPRSMGWASTATGAHVARARADPVDGAAARPYDGPARRAALRLKRRPPSCPPSTGPCPAGSRRSA